jgi:Fe-S-cluster containining protein
MCDLSRPTQSMSNLAFLAGESGQLPRMERDGRSLPGHEPRTTLQRQPDRADPKERAMVGTDSRRRQILEAVADLYAWIDAQLVGSPVRSGRCSACGACCDFASYGHRLFVTSLELIYLAEKLHTTRLKPMQSERCPYQENGKCGVHEHRFSACRIFCCNGDADFQSELSEAVIKRLKTLCERLDVPYRYADLGAALAAFTIGTCQSAEAPDPGDCADRCT